ncbi:hypothetical protein [Neptuniibacter sp. QD34_54]|uniref:hypothetical protein n=1 Tax=Neptuniibacter sp. QD34_54 TaxID=3398208 RepID=UPI0039F451B7
MDQFFETVGTIIAYGGGSAGVSYLLFQYLGKTWIENKFNQRLQSLKHDQNIEVQRLRVEIDSLLNGAVKLQEVEFKILPLIWKKLYSAQQHVSALVSPTERYVKINKLNDDELEDLLSQTKFMDSQKNELKRTKSTDLYRELQFRYELIETNRVFNEFIDCFSENSVLFDPAIKEILNQATKLFRAAIVSKEVGRECNDWKMQNEGWDKLKKEIDPLVDQIESLIYSRLQSHAKTKEYLTKSSSKDAESGTA